jgi:hypothetical protein
MAEPVLNASRVVARVSEGVAAGVPEHVSVDREGEAGAHADGLDVTVNGIRYERAAAFGGEDEGRARGLPPRVSRWSDGWRTARAGPDVERAGETLQDRADLPHTLLRNADPNKPYRAPANNRTNPALRVMRRPLSTPTPAQFFDRYLWK